MPSLHQEAAALGAWEHTIKEAECHVWSFSILRQRQQSLEALFRYLAQVDGMNQNTLLAATCKFNHCILLARNWTAFTKVRIFFTMFDPKFESSPQQISAFQSTWNQRLSRSFWSK